MENGLLIMIITQCSGFNFPGGVKADMWEYMRPVHTENIFCEQPFDEFVKKKPSVPNSLVSEPQLCMNADLAHWHSGEWKHLEASKSLLISVLSWMWLTPYQVAQFSCWFKSNWARTFSCPELPLLTQLFVLTDPKSSKLVRLSRGPSIFPNTD